METKIKILVTSIGSLVGQNIQDVLEYPLFKRRDMIKLIGTNSIATSPNNFRCDKCYIVPNTNTQEFQDTLIEIILKETPDLILSGRDEDTETVAILMERNKELPGKLPYGKPITLRYALNKWETWNFCQKYDLPFASTFVFGKSGELEEFRIFAEKYEYPLIAKPIQGFASKGVFFIKNEEDALIVSKYEDYMFQEYLGIGSSLSKYFTQNNGLTPLFSHAPDVFHHSCHTVINPDGSFAPIFISRNEHDSGVTVGFKKVEHPVLEELTKQFVNALYLEGGYGPVTVQFREDKFGNWKAQEMNIRTNGNTFPRFIMGQDDIGLIMNGVLPELNFPIFDAKEQTKHYIIGKCLTSYIMTQDQITELRDNKSWSSKHKFVEMDI